MQPSLCSNPYRQTPSRARACAVAVVSTIRVTRIAWIKLVETFSSQEMTGFAQSWDGDFIAGKISFVVDRRVPNVAGQGVPDKDSRLGFDADCREQDDVCPD